MLKLIHTGDIHLDSPFTLEDAAKSEARRGELRDAFHALTEYIRNEDIQLCLIAGDLFEHDYATRDTVAFIVSEFVRTPNCRFVISPGNHDPYTIDGIYDKTEFPENVFIFKESSPSRFDFPELGCSVYGYAFTSQHMSSNPLAGVRPVDPDAINIACAHADVLSPISKYCPMTERDIAESGFDYVALGHIHNSRGIKCENGTYYAYCGCLEGRDYSESGYKGAIAGTISKSGGSASVALRGVRFSRRRYADERLNVTGFSDISEVRESLSSLVEKNGYGGDTLLRVTFEGSVSPDLRISPSALYPATAGLYSFEMRDDTMPLFDMDKLMRDNTIRGAFFRRLLPDLQHGTSDEREVAAEALRYGFGALDGADIIDF